MPVVVSREMSILCYSRLVITIKNLLLVQFALMYRFKSILTPVTELLSIKQRVNPKFSVCISKAFPESTAIKSVPDSNSLVPANNHHPNGSRIPQNRSKVSRWASTHAPPHTRRLSIRGISNHCKTPTETSAHKPIGETIRGWCVVIEEEEEGRA